MVKEITAASLRTEKLSGRWVIRIHPTLEEKKRRCESILGRYFPEWIRQVMERQLDQMIKSQSDLFP